MRLLDDPSPLVRAMAVWAAARLLPPHAFADLAALRFEAEPDADVRREWEDAMQITPETAS